jgi:hypothetical protein
MGGVPKILEMKQGLNKLFGGLGILDLEKQNKCLLGKWLFNLINGDGVWQQLIRNKYLSDKSFTQVNKKWRQLN